MKRLLVRLCLALCLPFLACAPAAEAWGCRGHETVAALAEKHLTPQAKQALLALLTANTKGAGPLRGFFPLGRR